MDTSEYSERQEELEEVTQSQKLLAQIFSAEIPQQLLEYFTIYIKPEIKSTSPISGICPSRTIFQVFSEGTQSLIQVKSKYTIWQVKILLFEQMGGAEGFDPPAVSLYHKSLELGVSRRYKNE